MPSTKGDSHDSHDSHGLRVCTRARVYTVDSHENVRIAFITALCGSLWLTFENGSPFSPVYIDEILTLQGV